MQSFGKYSYGTPIIHWASENAKLTVGKFCSIGGNVNIYLGGNHRLDWVTTYPFGHINQNVFNTFNGQGHPCTRGDVIIGNGVWIANNVTIMSGVTIGDGAVIANNSHVVKNVEPYSLVGGNPAKFIKHLFTPEQIKRLLEIKWWDWEDLKINKYVPLLCGKIELFLQTVDGDLNIAKVEKKLTLETHNYDGEIINELPLNDIKLMSVGEKKAAGNILIAKFLGANPQALQYLRMIVNDIGTSNNFDSTNNISCDDLIYLCSKYKDDTVFIKELEIQLLDMSTGFCAQGRSHRLYQALLPFHDASKII